MATASSDYYDFRDVTIGDTISFLTADNGFDGSGGFRAREGTVTGKTDKSITVVTIAGRAVQPGVRFVGVTARIRRVDWSRRSPRLIRKADPNPATKEADMASKKQQTDDALRAIEEANLSDAGFQYLIGALADAAPEAVHAALASLRRIADTEPDRSVRYFRTPA